MNDMIGLEQTEEVILTSEVSDEALESATGTGGRKSGELHTFLLHCFRSLPRPLNRRFILPRPAATIAKSGDRP